MTLNHDWYYLPSGKRQHLVHNLQFSGFQFQKAICGVQVMAALPAVARWHNDPEGLATRDRCQTCVETLEKEKAFA